MSNNIREDCGSSNLNYSGKTWDKVCHNYFKNSGWNIENFYGDVLYVGMGSNYGPRNQSKNVKTTTILEKYDHIIEKFNDPSKDWRVIKGDAYNYDFKDEKFDIIVLDIWAKYIHIDEFKIIYPKFKKYLKKDGKIHVIKTIKVRK